ncbi:MAG: hypothetical protein ACRDOU_18350 [Streptosporangiaceae bacterium]
MTVCRSPREVAWEGRPQCPGVPTKPQFQGPIRPLLQLTHITIDRQVAQLLRSDNPRQLKLSLSQQLAQGWTRYFLWETLIAAGFAVVALLALADQQVLPTLQGLVPAPASSTSAGTGQVQLSAGMISSP